MKQETRLTLNKLTPRIQLSVLFVSIDLPLHGLQFNCPSRLALESDTSLKTFWLLGTTILVALVWRWQKKLNQHWCIMLQALPSDAKETWTPREELMDLFSIYLGKVQDSSKQSELANILDISEKESESLRDLVDAGDFKLQDDAEDGDIFWSTGLTIWVHRACVGQCCRYSLSWEALSCWYSCFIKKNWAGMAEQSAEQTTQTCCRSVLEFDVQWTCIIVTIYTREVVAWHCCSQKVIIPGQSKSSGTGL